MSQYAQYQGPGTGINYTWMSKCLLWKSPFSIWNHHTKNIIMDSNKIAIQISEQKYNKTVAAWLNPGYVNQTIYYNN